MDGPKELMVTKASAERVGHLSRDIDHLPSNSDHRGLVRFEHAQDAQYRSTIGQLGKLTGAATCRVELAAEELAIRPGAQEVAQAERTSR